MDAAAEIGRNPVSKHQIQPECGDEQADDAGRDGRTRYTIMSPILSTCPLHTSSGCGIREARIDWSMVICIGSAHYCNYLKDYWPCAGGPSAVNAIGTRLREPTSLGLSRWRMAV